MSHILQLNPPIPMWTEKGEGLAIFVLDYGVDYDLMYTVIISKTGEIWTLRNSQVRGVINVTLGRLSTSSLPPVSPASP